MKKFVHVERQIKKTGQRIVRREEREFERTAQRTEIGEHV